MKRIIGVIVLVLPLWGQSGRVVVRPRPIYDVLVNPGMGLQSFQRFRQQDFHTGERWEKLTLNDGDQAERADVPQAAVAYIRWYWFQIEPEQGKPNWEIIDNALAEARRRGQQLMIRLMPYGGATRQMPDWYQKSGARRANKPGDKDGDIWSPDADDPLYLQHWGALIRGFGARYDGHPSLDSIDISTVGYWGEGWGPYLPSKTRQRELIDLYFDAFQRTPLIMNFDEPEALKYGVERGAGWRNDCWGDLGGRGKGMMHMLDMYPQQLARLGLQDAWRHGPVSLESCGWAGTWKQWGYTAADVQYSMDQALRWHASTINMKSFRIPEEWQPLFTEFQKKIGYRFLLRKLEYPRQVRAGHMMPVHMWWLNAGVSPIYHPYQLAVQWKSPDGAAAAQVPVDIRKWLPGDAVYDGSLYVDHTLKPGTYRLRVAMLDPRTLEPAIRLAIEGRQPDGWYDLGEIEVR